MLIALDQQEEEGYYKDDEEDDEEISDTSGKTTSTGVSISGYDSVDSDFDMPIGGKFWDGMCWRCEECNEALVEDQCPNGHVISPCAFYDLDDEAGDCTCTCKSGDDEGVEVAKMVCDYEDNIWRCTACA